MGSVRMAGKVVLLVGMAVMLTASSNLGLVRNAAAAPKFSDWSTPVNLGPVINSAFIDQGPTISKDGLSLFFQSDRPGGFGGNDIWVTQRASTDDPWGPPVNLGSGVNTAANEGFSSLSRDGHWMFMNSNRPGGFGQNDIWVAYREQIHDDFGWEAPVNLGPGVNTAYAETGAGYFENDDLGVPLLYFDSDRPGGLGGFDIYLSAQQPDGSWGPAENVPGLNSPVEDRRPMIRFDGLELFLFSRRPGGLGVNDIWVSTRDSVTDSWNTPVNLGPTVNSPQQDVQGDIASDRTTLYFTSNRPGGLGGLDLYVTTRLGPGRNWEAPVDLGPDADTACVDQGSNCFDDFG